MKRFRYTLRDFIHQSIQNNYGLLGFTVLAVLIANSPWQTNYLTIQFHLHFWINDVGMSLFFFLIGMELKREWYIGELKTKQARILPALAALGGMIMPALIFLLLNHHNPETRNAAAIPMATDIAFALGALQLLGNRINPSEKMFLLSLAVFDDLGAILIIALFYSKSLAPLALLLSLVSLFLFWIFRKRKISRPFYFINGIFLWLCFFRAGIHPTLAGVITGLMLPFHSLEEQTQFSRLEKKIHAWVSLLILPAFALLNAGFIWTGWDAVFSHGALVAGISLGLLLGKPLGILGILLFYLWIFKHDLPNTLTWKKLLGLSCLAGIGFTMSLFIGTLAFEFQPQKLDASRLAIVLGSLFSAGIGILCLMNTNPSDKKSDF